MSETSMDVWPARFDHVVTEHGNCIERCPACAHHASLGLNPDGTIAEQLATSLSRLRLGDALREVVAERLRQEVKWGTGSMACTGRAAVDPGHALAVLVEEVGEVSRAILEHEPQERVLAEITQVAAVAVAWVECLIDAGCSYGGVDCPGCNGTGRVDGDASVWCAMCDGHGGPATSPASAMQESARIARSPDATTAAIVSATTERAEAREALRQLAEAIGEPGIDADPLLCASRVNEHLELLRAERMPDDDELRELVRIAAGMSPEGRRWLCELADLSTGVAEGLDGALQNVLADAFSPAVQSQPIPQRTDGTPIWELVVDDMRARDATGRQKYGVPLQAHNGRKPLVDAYQEALDMAVYLRQELEERGGGR